VKPTPLVLGDIPCLCGHRGCEHYYLVAPNAPLSDEAELRCGAKGCGCESFRYDATLYTRLPGYVGRITLENGKASRSRKASPAGDTNTSKEG
jgi:hypothetical protein